MPGDRLATIVSAEVESEDRLEVKYQMEDGGTVWAGHVHTGNFDLPTETAEELAEWLEGREVLKSW